MKSGNKESGAKATSILILNGRLLFLFVKTQGDIVQGSSFRFNPASVTLLF
jgi:hypothetical protein